MQHSTVRVRATAIVAAALSVTMTGCGPSSSGDGTTPRPTGPTTTEVKPMDIAKAAKAPAQALILGTDGSNGSTIIPLAGADSSVSVDSMWVKMGPPATGGSSPVKLTSAPNADGAVRIGMYEEFAGGLGPQWRAGVWISSFVASSLLGKDLTDFKFTAEASGYVDGASASGLMTAGLLASLTGQPVDATVTMTGIINPDGTIGPVGGIPQKFAGSIEKGKRKLGYPIGMRYSIDINTGKAVDLVALARELGAEAVEVPDVYAAYTLLTGKKLPRSVPVDEAEMALDDEVVAAYEGKYQSWQQYLSQEWARILELAGAGRLPAGLVMLAQLADREGVGAEKLRQQGIASSAYQRIVQSWIYAASATSTSEILELVTAGDLVGAKAKLREFEGLASRTEEVMRQIGTMRPDTMGGHLQMLSAYQVAIQGLGFQVFATDSAARARRYLESLDAVAKETLATPATADQVVENVAPAVLSIARAVSSILVATESIEIEGTKSLNYMCSLPNVRRLSTSYLSAATANLTYFETLTVKDSARELGMSEDVARNAFMAMEPDFLVATMAANLPNLAGLPAELKKDWGEGSLAWGLASLAASTLSYFKTSVLISKYYSLGVQTDRISGRAVAVQHEKAFMNMLASAERSARENARAARVATGSIPIQARIHYQNARILREGDVADKLRALEEFWAASVYAQTAVMLARN